MSTIRFVDGSQIETCLTRQQVTKILGVAAYQRWVLFTLPDHPDASYGIAAVIAVTGE